MKPVPCSAAEAGWHVSRYNVSALLPDKDAVAIANLFKGTCAEYSPIELYLMGSLDELSEEHPIIERLASRGVIVNFDELAAVETLGRGSAAAPLGVGLTICPTMGCNFDCPYCFEDHFARMMTEEVQDDVVAFAERMMKACGAPTLSITWFGGEPLLAPDIIESLSRRLMALANARGAAYRASIITNGYLLTPENVAMLKSAGVEKAQVTLDGIGQVHDSTRHLAGGAPTFERIVENLRRPIPFQVHVRHNVHADNREHMDELKEFVEALAKESGNELIYYPALVSGAEAADKRGSRVGLLCGGPDADVAIQQNAGRFRTARGHYCGAHSIWSVGIDDMGNLQKCWEAVDRPQLSFGNVRDWDPDRPFETASNVDNLTKYLNTACPIPDDECRECVWLPSCAGGCPYKRLFEGRACVPYKDDPEGYVLALHARIGEDRDT